MKIHLILFLVGLGVLTSCSKKAGSSSSSHALDASDFHTFIATPGTLNIVDFSASWCPPCQQLKPILTGLAGEYSDSVQLGIIDVDLAKNLAAQQGVRGIPDVRFYINGSLVHKFTGGAPKEHVEQVITNLLAKHDQELNQPADEASESQEPVEILPSNPTVTPHPDLVPPPASKPPKKTPAKKAPADAPTPAAPAQPTIQPSNGNQLPPGMSKG